MFGFGERMIQDASFRKSLQLYKVVATNALFKYMYATETNSKKQGGLERAHTHSSAVFQIAKTETCLREGSKKAALRFTQMHTSFTEKNEQYYSLKM